MIKGAEDETIRSGTSRYKKEALFNPYGTGIYRLDQKIYTVPWEKTPQRYGGE